jgi:predicted solute-binding protein
VKTVAICNRKTGVGVPIHEHRFAKREEREEVLDVFDAWLERLMEGGA